MKIHLYDSSERINHKMNLPYVYMYNEREGGVAAIPDWPYNIEWFEKQGYELCTKEFYDVKVREIKREEVNRE